MANPNAATALRVLLVHDAPVWDETSQQALDAARGLAARGHTTRILARAGGPLARRAAAHGVAVATCAGAAPVFALRARVARARFRPHVVIGGAPGLSGRIPWSEVLHGVAATTGDVARDTFAARRALRLPRKPRIVLHAAGLLPGGGHDLVLGALAALASEPGVPRGAIPTVAFLGTGPEEARLHVRVHALGVKEHVLWLGQRDDLERLLDAVDVLVEPVPRSRVPRAALEALARRVPVVAAGGEGTWSDLLEAGPCGLRFAPGDVGALAACLAELVRDAERAARLGDAGRARIVAEWNAARALDDLESALYAELLAARGAARRAALFVDRDDTLVRDVPYNTDPASVVLLPGAGRALGRVRRAGWKVLVVTNQSGIARGLQTAAQVDAVHARIQELLAAEGARVDGFYVCPHHPEHGGPCDCRKPAPGLLQRAAAEHGVDLACSVMVGDRERDLEAGRRAGAAVVAYGTQAAARLDAARTDDWLDLARDVLRAAWGRDTR